MYNPVEQAYIVLRKTLFDPNSVETDYMLAMEIALGYLGEALQ